MRKNNESRIWKIGYQIAQRYDGLGNDREVHTIETTYNVFDKVIYTTLPARGMAIPRVKINDEYYGVIFFKTLEGEDAYRYFAAVFKRGYGVSKRGAHYKKPNIEFIYEFDTADEGNREYKKICATNPTNKAVKGYANTQYIYYTWNV